MSFALFLIWAVILIGLLVIDKNIRDVRIRNKRRYVIFLVFPIFVFIILISFIQSVHTIQWTRFSHAIFVLGLWAFVLLVFFKIINRKNDILDVIRLLLSLGPILYLTPIIHYQSLFVTIPFVIPFIFGWILIIIYYVLLINSSRHS